MTKTCKSCETAQVGSDLHNGHCPQCRQDRTIMAVVLGITVPLLIAFGWAMLRTYG